jgi:hypothetical protein
MAFVKGQSGNPVGLNPREKAFANSLRLAMSRQDKEGITKLQRVANKLADLAEVGESWAVKEVADRIDGKPLQATELTGKDGGPIETRELSTEERARGLAVFIKKLQVEK